MADAPSEPLLKYANLLLKKGMHEEARMQMEGLLRRDPDCGAAHYLFASILVMEGRAEEAARHFRVALRLAPAEVRSWNGLGVALQQLGFHADAASCYRESVRIDPEYQDARINLALLLKEGGLLSEAEAMLADGLKLVPNHVRLLYNLANLLHVQGRSLEAVAAYRDTLRLDPHHLDAQQNLLFALHYSPRFNDREIFLEHLRGARRKMFQPWENERRDESAIPPPPTSQTALSASSAAGAETPHPSSTGFGLASPPLRRGDRGDFAVSEARPPQENDSQPMAPGSRQECRSHERRARESRHRPQGAPRIRLAYLSPDFREHSVARFIEPVLIHHDPSRFEIFCYSSVARPDSTTERLRQLAEHWTDLSRTGDETAYRAIVNDSIDVLIDLAGHTSGNRLPLLARKPARRQLTWIGYPDTTGLPQIDCRITDLIADPPGREAFHTERLIRLPRSFCCYLPAPEAPEVAPLPFETSGRITFGSFNNLAKVTPEMIALWGRVLQGVPQSRLLLKGRALGDPGVRARIIGDFAEAGVAAERVELHGGDPTASAHLAQYGRVDIALDTFPYNGTTTSCEALWMGVPVVTLAETRHASRTGASLLTNCGLPWLVAEDAERYIGIARGLAEDVACLRELRRSLRRRMQDSPLMDGAGVTRELEGALMELLQNK